MTTFSPAMGAADEACARQPVTRVNPGLNPSAEIRFDEILMKLGHRGGARAWHRSPGVNPG